MITLYPHNLLLVHSPYPHCLKAKQHKSGDLCGNITEFGWWKDHLSLQGEGDPSTTPNEVILRYSTPDEGCFVFISHCLMVLSHSKLRYMR